MGNTDGIFQTGQVDEVVAADSDLAIGLTHSERVVAQLVAEDADLGADVVLIVSRAVQDGQLVEVVDSVTHSRIPHFL